MHSVKERKLVLDNLKKNNLRMGIYSKKEKTKILSADFVLKFHKYIKLSFLSF